MKTKIVLTLLLGIVALYAIGCGGHEPNPVAAHQIGDDNRSCQSLRLEIAQNEALADKKTKKDDTKLGTNVLWFILWPPAMDLKEAEKTEAEALRHRNECLKILMSEKSCGATAATDPNEILQKERKIIGYKRAPDDVVGSEHAKWIPVYESKKESGVYSIEVRQ